MDNNLKILDLYNNTEPKRVDSFNSNVHSEYKIESDYEKVEVNFEWLDLMEDTVRYLDNILRNPNRFIINEEEVVKIEQAKRITVESIKHLSKHTNFIQEIEQNGDVRPSKILNINKEESYNTYENRFIYTLIGNVRKFFEDHSKNIANDSFYFDQKKYNYEANTHIGNEKVKISVNMESLDKNIIKPTTTNNLTIKERLNAIKIQLDSFTNSELVQVLSKLHVPQVRSPIRKTNVILKNPNFRIAEKLWNFIQSYNEDDCRNEKDDNNYLDIGELKKQYDQSFMYAYIANSNLSSTNNKVTEKKAISVVIDCLVRNILDYNMDIDEKLINDVFKRKFRSAREELNQKSKRVNEVLINKFKSTNEIIYEASNLLK